MSCPSGKTYVGSRENVIDRTVLNSMVIAHEEYLGSLTQGISASSPEGAYFNDLLCAIFVTEVITLTIVVENKSRYPYIKRSVKILPTEIAFCDSIAGGLDRIPITHSISEGRPNPIRIKIVTCFDLSDRTRQVLREPGSFY